MSEMRIANLVWTEDAVSCRHCGARLSSPEENWKDHALVERGLATDRLTGENFGPSYRLGKHEEVELAELFCPGCHALLSVETYLKGEPFRRDYRSLEGAAGAGYDPVGEFRDAPEDWVTF
jgi:acetone carboxylase gamma subunit